jgi:hypothetical protein
VALQVEKKTMKEIITDLGLETGHKKQETSIPETTIIQPNNIGQNSTMYSDSTNMTSQSNERQIIVTWLKLNETKPDSTSMISISTEDFWKTFEPLLDQSNQRD